MSSSHFCDNKKPQGTPVNPGRRGQFRYLVALTNHDPSPFVLPQRQCRYCPAMMAERRGDASFRRIAALSRNSNPYNNWERAEFDVGSRNSRSRRCSTLQKLCQILIRRVLLRRESGRFSFSSVNLTSIQRGRIEFFNCFSSFSNC